MPTTTHAPRVYSSRPGATPEPPADCVYVGRPTRFGNPFALGRHGDRAQCISMFRRWLSGDEEMIAIAGKRPPTLAQIRHDLGGRNLRCWCAPEPCHADVLLEMAND